MKLLLLLLEPIYGWQIRRINTENAYKRVSYIDVFYVQYI